MAVVLNPKVKIQYTQEVNRLLPGGRNELRTFASFQVGTHGPFSVEIPSDGFTVDALYNAINAKADELAKLLGA
jgi:hypothetical protein